MNRRTFLGVAAASTLAVTESSLEAKVKDIRKAAMKAEPGIHIRFLGTGAADWNPADRIRRLSSVLVEGSFLLDLTPGCLDMLPEGCSPDTIFYTHSHGDHYNPGAALDAGVKHVYVNNSWFDRCRMDFSKAAKDKNMDAPQVTPLCLASPVTVHGVTVTQLPANHSTSYLTEQTVLYLLEKDGARVIYATDTGGIPAYAARIAGIDGHSEINPISGLIMESTMGMEHEEDFRLFTHSSAPLVARTVSVLQATGALKLPTGESVYLTHLARTLNGTQEELDRTLPAPLKAAYDGLEVTFKPLGQ